MSEGPHDERTSLSDEVDDRPRFSDEVTADDRPLSTDVMAAQSKDETADDATVIRTPATSPSSVKISQATHVTCY